MNSDLTLLKKTYSDLCWPRFDSLNIDSIDTGSGASAKAVLQVIPTEELHWFAGHFPSQPVLPGVVQTHWAGKLVRHIFSPAGTFSRIENLKFHSVVLPNMPLTLTLYQKHSETFTFTYHHNEQILSEGKLVFC